MSDTVESDYYAFMRFDPENAKSVLSYYVPFFTEGPVLELACGPGVFLSLLGRRGLSHQAWTSIRAWSTSRWPRDTT